MTRKLNKGELALKDLVGICLLIVMSDRENLPENEVIMLEQAKEMAAKLSALLSATKEGMISDSFPNRAGQSSMCEVLKAHRKEIKKIL